MNEEPIGALILAEARERIAQSSIYELRVALADRIAERDEAAWQLRLEEARCMVDFSESVGGDWKALGPNEEARKYSTIDILRQNEAYPVARTRLREAERAVRLAEAECEAHIEAEQRAHDAALMQSAGVR